MERSVGWLRNEMAGDDERRHTLAHQLGVPFVHFAPQDIALEAMVIIPEPIAREHNLVAYNLRDHTLEVATLNLDDLAAIDFLTARYRIVPRLTTRETVVKALLHYQKHLREVYGKHLTTPSAPNLLQSLLRHALASGASDIHLEQTGEALALRYRIAGVMKEAMTLSSAVGRQVLATLRTLANVPAGAAREGRVRVDLGHGEEVLVRIASAPLIGGEKLLLSISREKARQGWSLESLGLHGEALERVHQVLLKRKGLVAVRGMGKTTLCYTLLDLLNVPELSLSTVEESVAQNLPRVAQTDTAQAGVSMAGALRATLRLDPDVVMIDTIAATEVATVATSAAKRGVFIIAATDIDIDATLTVTTGVVRRLCTKQFTDKRKLTRAEAGELEEAGANFATVLNALKQEGVVAKDTAWKDVQFARAHGCSECDHGYKGQIGLQEVSSGGEVAGLNIIEDGLFKAAQGLTSIDEVLNLIKMAQ